MLRLASVVVFALQLAAADDLTRFAGRWKMDLARSDSAHRAAGLNEVMLSIRAAGSELTVETTTRSRELARPAVETLVYRVDGQENSTGAVVTRARRDGGSLVTEVVRTINGAPVLMRHTFTVSPGGKELMVGKRLSVQHGYQSAAGNHTGVGRDIFLRVK